MMISSKELELCWWIRDLHSEAGELISAGLQADDMAEIGELLEISAQGWTPKHTIVQQIRRKGDVTIFKSVGVGIQDVAIAHAVVQQAEKNSIGQFVDL